MIKFVDPRGRSKKETETYELSLDLRANGGAGLTVALLANGFPDSEIFIEKVGAALKSRLPGINTRLWNKGNAALAASAEVLTEIVGSCQAAIAAYGH